LQIRIGNKTFDFANKTHVMGILNVTPDSFSDGGKFFFIEDALIQAKKMVADGADFIDIGGESTRPGSERVSLEGELNRVIPVIEQLARSIDVPISIDTNKAEVAKKAIEAGATIVNDISGMTFDDKMAEVVAKYEVPVIIMHTADDPKVMQKNYEYNDVVEDIFAYFTERIEFAEKSGIPKDRIILDPGIGFGKSVEHNLQLIGKVAIEKFSSLGCPVLIGTSRKSFIGLVLDLPVEDRLEGSLATAATSAIYGAHILRVHDVKETFRICRMCDVIGGRISRI